MNSIFLDEIGYLLKTDELIEKLCIYEDDIVFLSGSLVESRVNRYSKGIGNIYSDLDVFIIRTHSNFIESNSTYTEKYKKTDFMNLDLLGIDVEIFDKEFVDELWIRISNINFSPRIRIANSIDIPVGISEYSTNSFLNRFINAVPIYNCEEYEDLKKKLMIDNWIKFQRYTIENSIENILTDVDGNIQAKRFEVSVLCSRVAFTQMIKYLILSVGDLVDREKWLPVKLKNVAKYYSEYNDIVNFYNKLFFSDITNPKHKEEISIESIVFIRRKLEEISMEELL